MFGARSFSSQLSHVLSGVGYPGDVRYMGVGYPGVVGT